MNPDISIQDYWNQINIPEDEQQILITASNSGVNATVQSALGKNTTNEIQESTEFLHYICEKYVVPALNKHKKSVLTVQNICNWIDEAYKQKGQVIGLTGQPGTGKTTLLKILEPKKFFQVDEFWNQRVDHRINIQQNYFSGHDTITKRKNSKQSSLVAAAFIESNIVDKKIHLQTATETRYHNLKNRCAGNQTQDYVRLNNWNFYKVFDTIQYEIQKINSDIIVDTSYLRY